jgi:TolB-like protein/DNA-binding winged helix-turn-helix (wHTH) protein
MDRPAAVPLRIGAWRVDPTSGQITRNEEVVRLDGRTMQLLLCLAEHAGQVVSIDDLLDQVWSGVIVTPDSVYQGVASLRRLLRDDAKEPKYIATVPRLGYRMVARVSAWDDDNRVPGSSSPTTAIGAVADEPAGGPAEEAMVTQDDARTHAPWRSRKAPVLAAGAVVLALALIALLLHSLGALQAGSTTTAVRAQSSVAVMPFLDLTTQEMNEEYFADGMTEELISQLSKIPGLQVPPPTSAFYFKGKQVTVAEVAKSLGVTYVLDGSVRKSDATLRVAARLVRAADGYVIWSETYDRSADDRVRVQEDIAGEVSKALRASLDSGNAHAASGNKPGLEQ